MRLLVGLGNPGTEYGNTRHNLGFVVLQRLLDAKKLKWQKKHGGELVELDGNLLFRPLSFMNRSGEPIKTVVDYYKIEPTDLCIVADDIYIAPGTARIRHGGGDGGHNGWKSVLENLQTDTFWRVRIGAGVYEQRLDRRAHQPAMDEYVLQRLSTTDRKHIDKLIDKIVPDLLKWLESGQITVHTLHI